MSLSKALACLLQDFEEGKGGLPQDGQQVTFDYTAYNESGARIDSTYQKGRPAQTRLGINGLIPGRLLYTIVKQPKIKCSYADVAAAMRFHHISSACDPKHLLLGERDQFCGIHKRDALTCLVIAWDRFCVCTGFEKGIKTMKVGGKRRLVVAPALGPPVGPSTFFSAKQCEVFDVELLDIKSCRRRQVAFFSDVVCE